MHDYYRGTFYGSPAATLMYELAGQLNSSTNEKLWLAIVGMMKQFIGQEMDMDNYNMMVQHFNNEVLSMNMQSQDRVTQDNTVIPSSM